MPDKSFFLRMMVGPESILVDSEAEAKRAITPQPSPTSPRIKDLLARAMMAPGTLSASEVQEMAASVVYFLINLEK